jgi:hypothetical protein
MDLEKLPKADYMVIDSIESVNFKPHPYCIDTAHVVYASDHCGGILDDQAIRDAERYGHAHCGMRGCRLPYDQHTSDRVAFVKLLRNVTQEEARSYLLSVSDFVEKNPREFGHKLDGFVFIETPEKFRIAAPVAQA